MATILEYAILLVFLFILSFPLMIALRRWRLRNHVWLAIDTKAGNRTVTIHAKPKPDNTVATRWGPYIITDDGFTRINPGLTSPRNVPLYRYVEGVRTPIKLSEIISENPGIKTLASQLDRALRDTKTLERNNWIRMMFRKTDYLFIAVLVGISGIVGALIGYGFAR